MLSRVTANYNSLQMHVLTLMQQRNNHRGLGAPGHEVTHEQRPRKPRSMDAAKPERTLMDSLLNCL